MMDIERFARQLGAMLNVSTEAASGHPDQSLYNDWDLDSLQSFQLIFAVESLAEVLAPPAYVPDMYTVRDAYDYYRSLVLQNQVDS